jgi:signal transduction histidine kinase
LSLACIAVVISYYLGYLDFLDKVSHTLGFALTLLSIGVFFLLLLMFAYFLFRVSYFGIIVFSLLLIGELVFGGIIVHKVVSKQIHNYLSQLVGQTTNLVKVEVNDRLNSRVLAVKDLAHDIRQSPVTPMSEQWQYDAASIMKYYPGFQALEWVGEDYTVKWIVPSKGNKMMLGRDVRINDERIAQFEEARKTGETQYSQSIELVQGKQGFLIVIPVTQAGVFKGYVVGVVAYKKLLARLTGQDIVPGYSIIASVNGQEIFKRGELDPELQQRWQQTLSVSIGDINFDFEIWPSHAMVGQEGRLIISALTFVGVLFFLLMLMVLLLILMMQRYNKRLVDEMIERGQMKKALMQSQKLEAVGTLAGGIAHNFNNILYSIGGYTQLIQQDVAKDSQAHTNLGRVMEGVKRGQDLVGGILSFSRRDNAQFTPIVFKEVLDSTLDLMRSTLPATLELIQKFDLEDQKVAGNHTQLQQVFMNIIGNAVDAMSSKGEVIISACVIDSSYIKKHYPGLTYAACFEVKIIDHGQGIDKATKQRLFEPFFTTKDIDKGTGLGLATSRSIIEDHEGTIRVESEVAKGTTFAILLPVFSGN